MKRYLLSTVVLCLTFSLGFLVSNQLLSKKNDKTSLQVKNSADNEWLIAQEHFDAWVLDIAQTNIPGYKFNSEMSNTGFSARAMNKELSFGKREILTTTGEIDFGKDTSTEKTLVYENKSKFFTVSFMINSTDIGQDFQGSDWLYSEKEVFSVPLIVTYKNLIILTTLQDQENYVNYEEAIELSQLIVKKIKEKE